MRKFGVIAAAGMFAALFGGQAYAAAPVCTSGTTNLGFGAGLAATLADVSGNHCVEAGDKIFGSASVGGTITGTGSINLTALLTDLNHVTIAFQGTVTDGTGNINYSVAVDPALSGGRLIDDLQKDFTLNGATGTTATLQGNATNGALNVSLTCTRTIGGVETCPVTQSFALQSSLSVTQNITAGTGAIVTGITDTISEVPEPASLFLFGSGLLAMGLIRRRRRGNQS